MTDHIHPAPAFDHDEPTPEMLAAAERYRAERLKDTPPSDRALIEWVKSGEAGKPDDVLANYPRGCFYRKRE